MKFKVVLLSFLSVFFLRCKAAETKQEADAASAKEVLTEFQYWPQLPHDLKCKIMKYVQDSSDIRRNVLHRIVTASRVLCEPIGFVNSAAVDTDYLYIERPGRTIQIWDKETGELLKTFQGYTKYVFSVADDTDCIYSGSSAKTERIWDLTAFKAIDRWLKGGCTVSQIVDFEQDTHEIKEADPVEVYRLFQLLLRASETKQKVTFTKKQQAYWNALPKEVTQYISL